MSLSSIVIKVTYQSTLRRFNVNVKEDDYMELNIKQFRSKICSLFKFPPESNFTLTYKDEDGDEVTLDNDEDLRDIVIQGINQHRPIRITALHINSNINPAELIRHAIAAVYRIIISGSLKPPALSELYELYDTLFELEKCYLDYSRQHHTRINNTAANPVISEGMKSNEMESCFASFENGSHDRNNSIRRFNDRLGKYEDEKMVSDYCNGQNNEQLNLLHDMLKCLPTDQFCKMNNLCHKDVSCDGCGELPIAGPRFKSKVIREFILCNICFGNMAEVTGYDPSNILMQHGKLINRDLSYCHYGDNVCDNCGYISVVGPLIKSKVKVKFDLCHICYTLIGDRKDYTCYNFPTSGPLPSYDEPTLMLRNSLLQLSSLNTVSKTQGAKLMGSKLDNEVISENVHVKAEVMSTSVRYTKTWRVRNTGTLPWTYGLQLVWVGGDQVIGLPKSVDIQVPAYGVGIGEILDISVTYKDGPPTPRGAPTSRWRMADIFGNLFGQYLVIDHNAPPPSTNKKIQSLLDPNYRPQSMQQICSIFDK